jgi:hypothetical protein
MMSVPSVRHAEIGLVSIPVFRRILAAPLPDVLFLIISLVVPAHLVQKVTLTPNVYLVSQLIVSQL